jgi:hypothetical protein
MHTTKFFKSILMLLALLLAIACSDNATGPEGPEGSGIEGPEGTGGEAGESGTMWNINDTADEIVNGVKLILNYNSATQAFEGTLENMNTNVAQHVRVEVHVYDAAGNSKEYGPTTPGDMTPGEKRNVTLPIPGAGNITKFQMHAEVGSSSSGGEGGGGEGSEGGGN